MVKASEFVKWYLIGALIGVVLLGLWFVVSEGVWLLSGGMG